MNKSRVLEDLKKLQEKCKDTTNIETEEATKHSLILPMLSALGYDVFDNNEIRPEFTADVGTKKGEKVDYVVLQNGQPTILIEAKQVGTPLKNKVDQLFRYFVTTTAKLAILTDGVKYLFYTDSQKANIMDSDPYMTIDMIKDTEVELERLLAYHKENLNISDVIDTIKYDQFAEESKKFIEELLEMRPATWLIRKIAEDCQILEPYDAKLAEILNKQLGSRLEIELAKQLNTPKVTKVSSAKTKQPTKSDSKVEKPTTVKVAIVEDAPTKQTRSGKAKLTDEIFKYTKGIKIIHITMHGSNFGEGITSWRELYKYIFYKCTDKVEPQDIYRMFNKDDTRKYIYNENCEGVIKDKSNYMEDKNLYLYQHLSGGESVHRSIEACNIFGVLNAESIEVQYEEEKIEGDLK